MKKILAAILALIAAFFILKAAMWLFRLAFTLAIDVVQVLLVLIIALPVYVIISRRLLR